MFIKIALIVSVLLQFGAFFITISLIKKTKFNISWIMVSIGFFLMAVRRLSDLISIVNHSREGIQTYVDSWIAVFISLVMFVGSFYIRQIFNLQDRINRLRKENESKVLSAIIRTEEKERQKFSKELHDGLGPLLSSIKMAISAINKDNIGERNEKIIGKTESAINEAIIAIKEISNNLSPHILERFGLEKAIKAFIETVSAGKKMTIKMSSNIKGKRYDYNTEVVLYRIIGELITNTIKHAAASEIEIAIHNFEKELELVYSDNGLGFDMQPEEEKGMGLSNIKSRVKSLGGELEIFSKPKHGFFLKIKLVV